MNKLIALTAIVLFTASPVFAQSPICKGKAETDCPTTEYKGVKDICTWIKARETIKDDGSVKTINGYCRVKNRTLTADDKAKLAAN